MRHLDLCSGIGGIALGFERAGMTPIGFAEVDGFCSRVLAKQWPSVHNYGDITHPGFIGALQDDGLSADIISAGYPCQPFSLAGDRGGQDDDRHLWPVIAEIIDVIEPDYCFFENVIGHLSLGYDEVAEDLEALDYTVEAYCIGADAVGANHRRDRLIVLAHANRLRLQKVSDAGISEQTADAIVERCQASGTLDAAARFRHWESPEPPLLAQDDGIPADMVGPMTRAIGNAVTPLLAEVFGHVILECNAAINT